jgi:hypothetical protein
MRQDGSVVGIAASPSTASRSTTSPSTASPRPWTGLIYVTFTTPTNLQGGLLSAGVRRLSLISKVGTGFRKKIMLQK